MARIPFTTAPHAQIAYISFTLTPHSQTACIPLLTSTFVAQPVYLSETLGL